ncbi:MAG: hypothetical protein CM15mP77_2770 [Synechococcus sp.]|nr:MAG: hypothetical protein CM15mP77_2770 [Synechococcus sp.]
MEGCRWGKTPNSMAGQYNPRRTQQQLTCLVGAEGVGLNSIRSALMARKCCEPDRPGTGRPRSSGGPFGKRTTVPTSAETASPLPTRLAERAMAWNTRRGHEMTPPAPIEASNRRRVTFRRPGGNWFHRRGSGVAARTLIRTMPRVGLSEGVCWPCSSHRGPRDRQNVWKSASMASCCRWMSTIWSAG